MTSSTWKRGLAASCEVSLGPIAGATMDQFCRHRASPRGSDGTGETPTGARPPLSIRLMKSDATSVTEYLAKLPDARRLALMEVRGEILARLPDGFEEAMNWGMIAYQVPLERYPNTYNGKPLMYAALASQKNHMAVYLSGVYADEERREAFLDAYRASGKKLDMGKSCVRFKKLEDLPLELIGDTISSMSVDDFIEVYEAGRN